MQRNKAVITKQVDSSVIIGVFSTAGYLQLLSAESSVGLSSTEVTEERSLGV